MCCRLYEVDNCAGLDAEEEANRLRSTSSWHTGPTLSFGHAKPEVRNSLRGHVSCLIYSSLGGQYYSRAAIDRQGRATAVYSWLLTLLYNVTTGLSPNDLGGVHSIIIACRCAFRMHSSNTSASQLLRDFTVGELRNTSGYFANYW